MFAHMSAAAYGEGSLLWAHLQQDTEGLKLIRTARALMSDADAQYWDLYGRPSRHRTALLLLTANRCLRVGR